VASGSQEHGFRFQLPVARAWAVGHSRGPRLSGVADYQNVSTGIRALARPPIEVGSASLFPFVVPLRRSVASYTPSEGR